MPPLLTLSYWFSLRPAPFSVVAERGLLIGFLAFIVIGIACLLFHYVKRDISKPVKRSLSRFGSMTIWVGLFGLILWSFSYEQIPVLSMRIFFLILPIWFIVSVYGIVRYLRVIVPEQEASHRERIERDRWIPRKKK